MPEIEVREVVSEDNTLAIELLRQVKANGKRWFIAFIIMLVMFFLSNIAWLYAWNLPDDVITEEYQVDQDSEGNGNNSNYIKTGEINGKTKNNN